MASASRKRRGPEDLGMRIARQVARMTPSSRMRSEEKLEWRRRLLANMLRREGITYREVFDHVLLDASLRESQRASHAAYVREYGPTGRQPSSGGGSRKAPPLPESARLPIVVIYSDGSRSRHSEARIAYDYAGPRIKFMGPGAWAEIYREDTGSYHPETGSPFAALEVNPYGHVLHGGTKRRTRTAGDRRRRRADGHGPAVPESLPAARSRRRIQNERR